jgi:hypothetical protein
MDQLVLKETQNNVTFTDERPWEIQEWLQTALRSGTNVSYIESTPVKFNNAAQYTK